MNGKINKVISYTTPSDIVKLEIEVWGEENYIHNNRDKIEGRKMKLKIGKF